MSPWPCVRATHDRCGCALSERVCVQEMDGETFCLGTWPGGILSESLFSPEFVNGCWWSTTVSTQRQNRPRFVTDDDCRFQLSAGRTQIFRSWEATRKRGGGVPYPCKQIKSALLSSCQNWKGPKENEHVLHCQRIPTQFLQLTFCPSNKLSCS
jgi:hypothetical protein